MTCTKNKPTFTARAFMTWGTLPNKINLLPQNQKLYGFERFGWFLRFFSLIGLLVDCALQTLCGLPHFGLPFDGPVVTGDGHVH